MHFPSQLSVKRLQLLFVLCLEPNVLLVQFWVEDFVLYDGLGLWQVCDSVNILVSFRDWLREWLERCWLFAGFFLLFLR